MTTDYRSAFPSAKPAFAMLHLKGEDRADRLDRARHEIDLLAGSGLDAFIVENYFGDVDDVVAVLDHLRDTRPDAVFGINILKDDWRAFELAQAYGAAFLQLDSVAGHLPPDEDAVFAERLATARAATDALVFGGVRFKYQPYLSGRSLREDLELGVQRCDAIVVTGEGTGLLTPLEKTAEFREVVGDGFPLIIGAGVTPQNVADQLAEADGVIIGSALKDTLADTGDVSAENVAAFIAALRALPARV
ncbi:BtpA/SgcQ family protein [Microbacterium capsulatum]|uniref:BtpA/SgcQ family protein n=1 Tax=Microbacterium capsulatum TaxID=3041921 RepID=A0ABU0XJ57_9MICO|nr:BtpA/SgcQ family protein [Microbacterium sp. ASV81]MDQ4215172.1 BtpA/SgcQ family protein [Microbacterium sp. ASV81]